MRNKLLTKIIIDVTSSSIVITSLDSTAMFNPYIKVSHTKLYTSMINYPTIYANIIDTILRRLKQ